MTFKESIISEVATMLHSSEFQIRCEAANIPEKNYLQLDKSLQKCSQLLFAEITEMRDAEYQFFKSHPELNP